MKYKLIGDNNINNIKYTILKNRGVKDVQQYLNLNQSSLYDYHMLDNICESVSILKQTIEANLPIYIIVDSDADGYTSASILYHYINSHLNYKNIQYILQNKKEHGLSENIVNYLLKNPIGLVLIPDAGTNDTKECKTLCELGFKVVILDHHQKENENEFAVIVNNQTCSYPNKNLCGVGIVYKFLQALDDEYWLSESDKYLDLVALGNISDVMDLRECETKYLVDVGLKNIVNPLFLALLKKQSFSIKNTEKPTVIDISFYITPLINALIRFGTEEEKDMIFKAFIMDYAEYDYTPKKTKNNPNPEVIKENIYDRVARLCLNAKSRQSRIQNKAVDEIIQLYDKHNKTNSICFINATKIESVSSEITGLVAIKIASEYSKPCLILRKDTKKSNDNNIIFSGSARNINDGFIDDLKYELESSDLFEMLIGHSNAFGVSIKKENILNAIEYFNNKYKNIDSQKCYKVDFIFNENIDYAIIKEIYSLQDLFSGFVKEPLIAIENVNVDLVGFDVFGNDNKKHWKFQNGLIQYIKFNASSNDELLNLDTFENSKVVMNVVGKTNLNLFNGKLTPQVIVEDYEILYVE